MTGHVRYRLWAFGFRGGAPSEAAAIVIVSSGLYEFLHRETRGRVPRPAGGS